MLIKLDVLCLTQAIYNRFVSDLEKDQFTTIYKLPLTVHSKQRFEKL